MESKASINNFYFLPTVAQKKAYLTLYLYMKIIRPLAFCSFHYLRHLHQFHHHLHIFLINQLPLGQTELKIRNN
jgi:hypothetical protein